MGENGTVLAPHTLSNTKICNLHTPCWGCSAKSSQTSWFSSVWSLVSSLEFFFKLGWWDHEKWRVIKREHCIAVKLIIFVTLYYIDHETLAQSLTLPYSPTRERQERISYPRRINSMTWNLALRFLATTIEVMIETQWEFWSRIQLQRN